MMVKYIFVIFLIGINMDLDSQAEKSFETRRLKSLLLKKKTRPLLEIIRAKKIK
jgi:hypothetical protein